MIVCPAYGDALLTVMCLWAAIAPPFIVRFIRNGWRFSLRDLLVVMGILSITFPITLPMLGRDLPHIMSICRMVSGFLSMVMMYLMLPPIAFYLSWFYFKALFESFHERAKVEKPTELELRTGKQL